MSLVGTTNNPGSTKRRMSMDVIVLDPRFQAGITDYRNCLPPAEFGDGVVVAATKWAVCSRRI